MWRTTNGFVGNFCWPAELYKLDTGPIKPGESRGVRYIAACPGLL